VGLPEEPVTYARWNKAPAIGGRPAIGGAPETARCGFAAYRSAFGNGTLDADEIWYGSWPLYDTHSCQVSRQSIMAFVR